MTDHALESGKASRLAAGAGARHGWFAIGLLALLAGGCSGDVSPSGSGASGSGCPSCGARRMAETAALLVDVSAVIIVENWIEELERLVPMK